MSKEKWQQVTDSIDERHTDECAEYMAKHCRNSQSIDGTPVAIKLEQTEKPKKRGWIIGAAAAAVALCVGGGLLLSRGDTLLPSNTPTAEATCETDETNESAETIVELEFDDYDNGWQTGTYDYGMITAIDDQLYGLPEDLDVTALPDFKYVQEHLATLTEEEQAEHASRNYTTRYYSWDYLSYNTWVYTVHYCLDIGGKNGSYFMQYYIVKDNSIVSLAKEVYGDNIYDSDSGYTSMYWRDGVLFCHEGGIFKISADSTQATDIITSDSLCMIDHVTNNYILYHEQDGLMRVYDWYRGRITETDLRFYTENSEQYGAQIICTAADDRESFYSYELSTGAVTPLDMTLEECEALRLRYDVQSEAYAANYINDEIPDDIPEYAYNTITNGKFEILYKKTGERVTVSLSGIKSIIGDPDTITHELLGFCDDVLYLTVNENDDGLPCCLIAVDVNTFNTARLLFEEGGYIVDFNAQNGTLLHRKDVFTSIKLTDDLSAVEDEWETDEAPEYIFEPELLDDTSLWSTHTVYSYPIEDQVGYDVPVDITTLSSYEYALEYAEQLDEQAREQLIANNYSELSLHRMYIGTNNADWLYGANYYLQEGGVTPCYYSRVFYVSDGKVGETILESYGQLCLFYEWGDTIVITSSGGVYQLDKGSTEPKKLFDTSGNFCRIPRLTDDYILFYDGDSRFKVYYPVSGEVFTTDIYIQRDNGPQYGFDGDCLVYCDSIQGTGKHMSFNIMTHELVDLGIGAAEFKELISEDGVHNENHSATTAGDFKVAADGFSWQFRELAQATEYDVRTLNVYPLGLDGDILYIAAKSLHSMLETTLIALDLNTFEAARYDFNQGYTLSFSEQTGAVIAHDMFNEIYTEIRYVGTAEKSEEHAENESVLTIWTSNDELARLISYIPNFTFINGGYTGYIDATPVLLKIVPAPNADGDYSLSLKHRLEQEQLGEIPENECIDIYLIEDSYAYDLINSSHSLPLEEIGITDEDTAQMYPYTKQLGTDENGALKAVAWQANPVAFAYRRSMAREVLGTDDPDIVGQYLSDRESFDNTAALMKQHGYYMLSGCENSYMSVNSGSWLDGNGEFVLPENVRDWLERAKLYADNGWSNDSHFWNDDWAQDFEADGKVFGLFFPPWGVNATLMYNAGEDGFGDWAVCAGPQTFYEGSTMLCVSPRTDNEELVAQVLKALTCDYDVMREIAASEGDYYHLLNNMALMKDISENYSSDFLGGQDSIPVFDKNAKRITVEGRTDFDCRMDEKFYYYISDYIEGEITLDEFTKELEAYAQTLLEAQQ